MLSREAYQEKLSAQLDFWRAKIDQLEGQARKADADARIRYNEQLEDLKAKQSAAEARLEELKTAGDDAWKDLRGGLEDAWRKMDDSTDSAVKRFKQ